MKVYELTLPLGPSDNVYKRHTRTGHTFLADEVYSFRDEVALAVRLAKLPKLEGDLWIVSRIYQKTKRMVDAHNYGKCLYDALQHAGLFENDVQLKSSALLWSGIYSGGKCEVIIGVMDAS